jgi:osmotically-inducible protein OsmY
MSEDYRWSSDADRFRGEEGRDQDWRRGSGGSQDWRRDYRNREEHAYGRGRDDRGGYGGYGQGGDFRRSEDFRGDFRQGADYRSGAFGGYGRDFAGSNDMPGSRSEMGRDREWAGGRGRSEFKYGHQTGYDEYPSFGGESYGRMAQPNWPSGLGRDYGREEWARGRRAYYGDEGSRRDRGEERGFFDRAGDEVSSWFGDENAERRRERDARRDERDARREERRGRGPRNYARSDDRIREDVCDRLTDDSLVDASDVEVAVSGSEVTLSGTVDSRDQRRRAEDLAERISGVTHVQNNLRVKMHGMSGTGSSAGQSGAISGSGMAQTAGAVGTEAAKHQGTMRKSA